MAEKTIKFISPITDNPYPGHTTMYSSDPATRDRVQQWLQPDQNFRNWLKPLAPGQKVNELQDQGDDLMNAIKDRKVRGG